jgi:hypothetical protein
MRYACSAAQWQMAADPVPYVNQAAAAAADFLRRRMDRLD